MNLFFTTIHCAPPCYNEQSLLILCLKKLKTFVHDFMLHVDLYVFCCAQQPPASGRYGISVFLRHDMLLEPFDGVHTLNNRAMMYADIHASHHVWGMPGVSYCRIYDLLVAPSLDSPAARCARFEFRRHFGLGFAISTSGW